MGRLRRFYHNAGWGGMIRVGLVGGLFTVMAVQVGGTPYALLWAAAWLVGFPLGTWFAAEPETRGEILNKWALGMMVAAFVVGNLRDRMNLDEQQLVTVMLAVVGAYLSSYFFFLSNPAVYRQRANGD
jgi:dolichol kinase